MRGSEAEHGDAKLTNLPATVADCPKGPRSVSVHDRCKAVYEGFEELVPKVVSLKGRTPKTVPAWLCSLCWGLENMNTPAA
jgi:hypothetical protein